MFVLRSIQNPEIHSVSRTQNFTSLILVVYKVTSGI